MDLNKIKWLQRPPRFRRLLQFQQSWWQKNNYNNLSPAGTLSNHHEYRHVSRPHQGLNSDIKDLISKGLQHFHQPPTEIAAKIIHVPRASTMSRSKNIQSMIVKTEIQVTQSENYNAIPPQRSQRAFNTSSSASQQRRRRRHGTSKNKNVIKRERDLQSSWNFYRM